MRATGNRRRASAFGERYDAVICGASFAGLAAARELAGSGARRPGPRPLRDRRAPDLGLRDPDRLAAGAGHDGGRAAALRRAGRPHPRRHRRCSTSPTPSRPSTTTRCANCSGASATRRSRSPTVDGRAPSANGGDGSRRDRPRHGLRPARRRRARLAADAGAGDDFQPVDAPLTRALEVHPAGQRARTSRSGSTAAMRGRATAGASRPARSCGSAPAPTTRATTSARGPTCSPPTSAASRSATRATGSRTSCARRPKAGVFFAGDSAGQCLALTAEGIRTALYYGIAARPRAARRLRGLAEPRAGARQRTPSSTTPTERASACCSSSSG